ncbi:MAG: hypothetical protein QOI89_507 [Solirubrobacteraceae bacterium]|jgi:hypothetical protein|nr:hypothetical protein [Solirubrobacteraceae bacterium]
MGGVRWTEWLSGWMSFDQTDFNQAMLEGRRDGRRLGAELTLQIDDVTKFIESPRRVASVYSGFIDSPDLGGRLNVVWGEFELLAQSSDLFDHLHLRMRYRLNLRDPSGRELRMRGFKLVENDPGFDSWVDTSTLFVRIYRGSWTDSADGDDDELAEQDERLVATGILRISPGAFGRELSTFRGTEGSPLAQLADVMRYGRCFGQGLAKAYFGRPIRDGRPSFPRDRPRLPWQPGGARSQWHPVPGRHEAQGERRPALERRIVDFEVPDLPFPLNLHHLRAVGGRPPQRKPVLLVPGAGVRAEMYYGQPAGETFADYLLRQGHDVWVESWRASIDLPNNSYTLDQAARYDHPAAVDTVLSETKDTWPSGTLGAVIHCQGSVGFTMSAVAGFLPSGVTHVVSSAISMFFEVPGATWLKQRAMMPMVKLLGKGADGQWAIRAQTPAGVLLAAVSRRAERQCQNGPCQIANFVYGSGWDVLLRHDNLDDEVHAWSARELGYTPFSLIGQVSESCRYGHIVPAKHARLPTPPSYVATKPMTDARFTFIGGDHNRMFDVEGQAKTRDFFGRFGLDAALVLLPGYGHLDTFWGRDAAKDVFPVIRDGLEWSGGPPAGSPPGDQRPRGVAPSYSARRPDRRKPAPTFSRPPVARSRVKAPPAGG